VYRPYRYLKGVYMSIKNQQQQELKLIDEALKIGPQSDRRRFFVSAAAFGAASAVAPLFANAQSAPGAAANWPRT
jgi:hypothetical protein